MRSAAPRLPFDSEANHGLSQDSAWRPTTARSPHHPLLTCFAPANAALLAKLQTFNAAARNSTRRARSRDQRTTCRIRVETDGPRTPVTHFLGLRADGTVDTTVIGASTLAAAAAAPLPGDTSPVSRLEALSSTNSERTVSHALSRRSHALTGLIPAVVKLRKIHLENLDVMVNDAAQVADSLRRVESNRLLGTVSSVLRALGRE